MMPSIFLLPISPMKLGAFSVSLNVKDIVASKEFYEKLGFTVFGGHLEQNWLILKNGDRLVGIFQGMFPKNMLTFNPGWDQSAKELPEFDDVRAIKNSLKERGIAVEQETGDAEKGPGSFVVIDPDGNPVLIDQHR